jgi:hypothetical protein
MRTHLSVSLGWLLTVDQRCRDCLRPSAFPYVGRTEFFLHHVGTLSHSRHGKCHVADIFAARGPARPVALIDLGEHRLADLARPERVFQVTHPEPPPLRSLGAHCHNFACRAYPFRRARPGTGLAQ